MENHVSRSRKSRQRDGDSEDDEEEVQTDEYEEDLSIGKSGGGRGRGRGDGGGKSSTRQHRPLEASASLVTSLETASRRPEDARARRCSSVKQSQKFDEGGKSTSKSTKLKSGGKQRGGISTSASLANISSNDPGNQCATSMADSSIPSSKSDLMLNGCMTPDELPNMLVYRKMEDIVKKMQDEKGGVPVKTVKSFMAKIPSVFTGSELVPWMMKYMDIEDTNEALHLAHLMAAHGYFFPIDDHVLTVKNDNTFYRFQTPYYWPSNHWEPENIDYAVYLCKRTMQNKTRLELVDYEAENLARLQKMFSRKWEFIFMQAEAQAKVDKKRDKLERKVLDSQERAFWDVHRPVPGCVNTTEVDIKKACRMNKPLITTKTSYQVPGGRISPSVSVTDLPVSVEDVKDDVVKLRKSLDRRRWKVSKVADAMCNHFEQYYEFDPFMTTPEPTNPWISESTEFWEAEKIMKDIPQRRVKRWGFSIHELLKDPAGKDQLSKFLEKEFSSENLRFWLACEELKTVSSKDVSEKVHEIYNEFLGPQAHYPINVDSRIADLTTRKVQNQLTDRHTFDEAQEHIFNLMKNDSYTRYLRSDMYREFLSGSKKKIIKKK